MSVVELESVSIRYERADATASPVEIVADYDLALDPGHMHCLAGRSGSGKTSILRVAAGLVRPTSGEVLWQGERLGALRDDAITSRRRELVGYLDQGGALIAGLTALENVLMPAVPTRRADPARVARA